MTPDDLKALGYSVLSPDPEDAARDPVKWTLQVPGRGEQHFTADSEAEAWSLAADIYAKTGRDG